MPSFTASTKRGKSRCRRPHRSTVALVLAILALQSSSSLRLHDAAEALALPSFRRGNGRSSGAVGGGGAVVAAWRGGNAGGQTRIRGLRTMSSADAGRGNDDGPVPHGPVPRGGSSAGANAAGVALAPPRAWQPLSRVRSGARAAGRGIVGTAMSLNALRVRGRRQEATDRHGGTGEATTQSIRGGDEDGAAVIALRSSGVEATARGKDPLSLPFVGRLFDRRNGRRGRWGAGAASAASDEGGGAHSSTRPSAYPSAYSSAYSSLTSPSSSGADGSLPAAETYVIETPLFPIILPKEWEPACAAAGKSGSAYSSSSSSSSSSASSSLVEMETYVIETPLFPIILPKSWEPIASAVAPSSLSAAASTATLEITVSMDDATSTAADAVDAKPSPQLLKAATLPLLPKNLMKSFTGRELYYPESIEALAEMGMRMTLGEGDNEWVDWTGEKKTDKFLRDFGREGKAAASEGWYAALDSSQEVLVWAGKFISGDGHGAELPIIKTTSIIHQSPKYLAELLMDSSRVEVYNKMSLGRTDEKVMQTGVDTQGGSFGDGESKVVRNLTKPPMVSCVVEFVTCMHSRKIRPSDAAILSPDGDDGGGSPAEGYIVVSRAVAGGSPCADAAPTGGRLVRNEILLGTNVLRAVPGEPGRTELTSVTHAHSTMIPAMLARGAGVKGAADFVRDLRALP